MPKVPTVLVADDEVIVLNFVSLVLRKDGFHVLAAHGGVQALEMVRKSSEPVSLAVLDLVMPDMNGPELFTRLREMYPRMRVLFMSGYNAPDFQVPAGCDLLIKPFTASELRRRLRDTEERPITQQA